MEGLVIREPWIGRILGGQKTWEMRSTACHKRGLVALIRARSGTVVGVADLVDSLAALDTPDAYAAAEPFHAIRPSEQKTAYEGGWRTPWVLANVRPLPAPVPYQHRNGAVKWVRLNPSVVQAIEEQLKAPATRAPATTTTKTSSAASEILLRAAEGCHMPTAAAPPAPAARTVRLTGGNIRHDHIYLPLDFFPRDTIGGRNKQDLAPRFLRVSFVPGQTVETDIDGSKRILRARSPVRDFLARAELEEGDSVLIERTAAYTYRFSKA